MFFFALAQSIGAKAKETKKTKVKKGNKAIPGRISCLARHHAPELANPKAEKQPAKTWDSRDRTRRPPKKNRVNYLPRGPLGSFALRCSADSRDAWAGRRACPFSS